jgi:peptidoglycan hydrolase-like protein with peptidoglycan-binding domain
MRAPARLRTALRTLVVPGVAVAVCLATVPAQAGAPRERAELRAAVQPPAPPAFTAPFVGVPGSAPPPGTAPAADAVSRGSARVQAGKAERWTGFAFDACRAPSSRAMDRWRVASPFLGIGIYIGGSLRACAQPHLTPGWIRHQTGMGWKLLPIWVGPQASCTSYRSRISARPGVRGRYPHAHGQGLRAARGATVAARRLGIAGGSTLWYDLEWYPAGNARCRRASLRFLSAWTQGLHRAGYVAGVYSSVSAGIAALGRERGTRRYLAPDRVWFAWANGRRDVGWSKYLKAPRWRENHRVHQYALDVTARYGGVRMAIDRNFVDLGSSSAARRTPAVCGRAADRLGYLPANRGDHGARVRVAQCLLRASGHYRGEVGGAYGEQTHRAVRSLQRQRGLPATGRTDRRTWTALLATGPRPVLKRGSEGPAVRRVQRALTAALPGAVPVHGHYGPPTVAAVARYQARHGLRVSGIVTPGTWHALRTGEPVHHQHRAKKRHGTDDKHRHHTEEHGHHAKNHEPHHGKAHHQHHGKAHHQHHGKRHHEPQRAQHHHERHHR